jgi:hypothetical protein
MELQWKLCALIRMRRLRHITVGGVNIVQSFVSSCGQENFMEKDYKMNEPRLASHSAYKLPTLYYIRVVAYRRRTIQGCWNFLLVL